MKFSRIFLSLLAFCAITNFAIAQKVSSYFTGNSQDYSYFSHLELATTVGTTGIGIDVATPLGKHAKLRAGISYMPRFEINSTFRVQVGDSLDKKWDKNGNRLPTKFDKLSGYLKAFTGYDVDDEVQMICKPTYYNFKLLVDIFPFPNKHWHITGGFFLGPSEIARAYNKTEEMPSLLSVSMWNMLHEKAVNWEPIYGDIFMPEALEKKLIEYGRMGFHAGDYLQNGPMLPNLEAEPLAFTETGAPIYAYDENSNPIFEKVKTDEKGKVVRAYSKGDPYMMVPDGTTGMVQAYIKTNRFKPYVGFGYGGSISKDKLTELSFDAGVMFWGGTPKMVTHDGTDLTHDVENVKGKLGRYVSTAKFFKFFPVLEIRISRRIF